MKLILLISQYFYPEMISTGHILTELVAELVRQGIKPSVICAQPTYYSNDKVDKEITYKGIPIRRTVNTQFDKNSLKGKLFNSFSFFIGALWLALKEKGRAPMILVTNPPFLGVVGLICKILKRRPYMLIIHDLYPDIAINMGYLRRDFLLALFWNKLNRKIYGAASFIVVLGRDVQKRIQDQIPAEQHENIKFIPNWADSDLIYPVDQSHNPFIIELGLYGKFLVQYSGNMGLTHDMEVIIEAAQALRIDQTIHFVFIGGGGKLTKIKKMVRDYGLKNIIFLPYQPRESLKYSLCSSHVSLVSLEKGAEGLSVPSKLYGIMASGRPIIAITPENTETALTIKEYQCGLITPPKDVNALVSKIIWMQENDEEREAMGKRAYKAFLDNFTVKHCANQYYDLIQRMSLEDYKLKK
jgi:glycosyltransferase involved in cell wall biosynthesis